ncbi:uncharacterized protein LOC124281174 [Haliotis rubra]|uniref:uncharacterized protein LOC124281174 n=1 Tax=Haliotis rubra TaxID=36100 RepID=UPI001EE4FEC0|nr:uncharacterized protein LOC124281174 [Haliotis rubra]
MRQMKPAVRSPFDCIAPPTPDGTLTYEGQEAVARYTCLSEHYGICDGNDVSRCRNNDIWTAPPGKCGRMVWKIREDELFVNGKKTAQHDAALTPFSGVLTLSLYGLVRLTEARIYPDNTSTTFPHILSVDTFICNIFTVYTVNDGYVFSHVNTVNGCINVFCHDCDRLEPLLLSQSPPLLDKAMVDVHYSQTAAVAVYSCDDSYFGGCDDNNVLYCTSDKGWEGQPRTCIRVDSGTDETVGSVDIPCQLKLGFAHEVWVEPKKSGSFVAFMSGNDTALRMTFHWPQSGSYITYSYEVDGNATTLPAESPLSFKGRSVVHIVLVYKPKSLQILVNKETVSVPLHVPAPLIDRIVVDGDSLSIKKVRLNQDWRQAPAKVERSTWSPKDCPFPPLLENMAVQISHTLEEAVATYVCDDGYGMCSGDNVVRCNGSSGWRGQPQPCEPMAFGSMTKYDFTCPLKLGMSLHLRTTPDWVQSKPTVSLQTRQTITAMGISLDLNTPGVLYFEEDGKPQQPLDMDFPAITKDTEYHVVFTLLSDYIQVEIDDLLITRFPHNYPIQELGVLATDGFRNRKVSVVMNSDVRKESVSTNLALNKPATSSSNKDGSQPGWLVDGNSSPIWSDNTCWSHTAADFNVYWEVDLQGYYYVDSVVITTVNCTGLCSTRSHDFEITVRSDKEEVCHMYNGAMPDGGTQRLACNKEVLGRYVRITPKARQDFTDLLTFCEVEVYGSRFSLKQWSPFDCGAPPVPKNSLMTLTYSDADAIATFTCNANSMPCGDVTTGVMRCSRGQVWTGATITCSTSLYEYDERDNVLEFLFGCPLNIFSSVEIWTTPRSADVKMTLLTDNNSTAMELVMDSTTDTQPFAYIRHHGENHRLLTLPFAPHQPAHIVLTILPESILLDINGQTIAAIGHVFDTLKAERLLFTNLPLRKLKLSKGDLSGMEREAISGNVALLKPAKGSSTSGSPVGRLVDGHPSATSTSTTCWQVSTQDPNPWWQVDLQSYYYIDRVAVTHNKRCAGCEKFLHDFEVEVLLHDPTLYPATPSKTCYSYPGQFPHGKRLMLDCLPGVFGRYVRIGSMKKLAASDSMTMCEVEVFVSKATKQGVVTDWSPFDCPHPPLPGGASVQVSHSATSATATYQCQEGFALCSGRTSIRCNSSSGWTDADIICKQAVFERMSVVELDCHIRLGDSLELWVTPSPQQPQIYFLDGFRANGIVLEYLPSTNGLEAYTFKENAVIGNAVPASDVTSLKSDTEWHVVLTILPDHLYISVNDRGVLALPNMIDPRTIHSVSGTDLNFIIRRLVWTRGTDVIKRRGPFDCALPPPTFGGANVTVETTGRSLVARYRCGRGTAQCGESPPSSTCLGGIWQTVDGMCFLTTFNNPDITKENVIQMGCPPVYSTKIHVFATPTMAQEIEIHIVNTATTRHTPVMTARVIFASGQYINTFVLSSNVTGDVIVDSFPFNVGQEFHMVITYLVKSFRVSVDGKDLKDVQVGVEGDFVPAVSMKGPMAVRTVEFQMSDNALAYNDQPLKPDTDNTWVTLPLSGSERTKLFLVKSCTEVTVDIKGDTDTGSNVQFTLGARKNTMTDCTICETKLTKWHSPLSCDDYRPFWLNWGTGGEMRVGAGYVIGRDFITSSAWPSTVNVKRIRISANANVKDVGNLARCTRPDPPPYNMAIDEYSTGGDTTTKYRCTDEKYVFCGEDSVSRCDAAGQVKNQVKGECRQMTWMPQSPLNGFSWPCQRRVGSTVSLYLTMKTHIYLSMMNDQVNHLTLNVDPALPRLTMGSTALGGVGSVPVNPFPLPVNKRFHLTITILEQHFEVRVDGTSVATFPHFANYTSISELIVEAPNVDVVHIFTPGRYTDCANATVPNAKVISDETSMGAEGNVQCNVEYRHCGSNTKVTCWSDGTWKFYRPEKCERYQWTSLAPLGKETLFPIPCVLNTGDVVVLQATLSRATDVFKMALVAGPEAVVLITYDQLRNSMIISNVLGGTALKTQDVANHGITPVAFRLSIKVLKDSYMIYVGGKMVSDFPSTSPSLRVTHISVSSGTAIRSLEVTTTPT